MAKIFVYDEFNPQDTAMMQALYSRSAKSVHAHVTQVKKSGSGKFMEKYYVGYGHSSIADCGSTTIFIEGISILADKAIQDWPLYSGQETSTRYIDMSKQKIIDPVGTKESAAILKKWMDFYVGSQKEVREHLMKRYPIKEGEKPEIYEKAIAARSFDTLRGFLPAGITTQLSWHTNLRQAGDKLSLLLHHPLPEVQEMAQMILGKLKRKYKHSFSHKIYDEQEKYRDLIGKKCTFFNPSKNPSQFMTTTISPKELNEYKDLIKKRPIKTNLPLFLGDLGAVTFDYLLDYGSFRDIQRHRNGVCRMPLLTARKGFHEWYLNELPVSLRKKAKQLIKEQKSAIAKLKVKPEIEQYYIAMGFKVPVRTTYGLPATVYVTELRSGRMVHPTLREIAHQMHHELKKKFPNLTLHSELDPSDWDVRRGLQDIQKK